MARIKPPLVCTFECVECGGWFKVTFDPDCLVVETVVCGHCGTWQLAKLQDLEFAPMVSTKAVGDDGTLS